MTLMHSPAAERNRKAILEQLRQTLPASGRVLEIASGSGQHVAYFAERLPGHRWQPSDMEPAALASITSYVGTAQLENVDDPVELDVRELPWPVADATAVLCSNMIHIAPWNAAVGLIEGAATLLQPPGNLHLYGPFKRGGRHTSPSNAAFDESLRARNPEWGVRDLEAVTELAADNGFGLPEVVEMPANNLFVTFARLSDS